MSPRTPRRFPGLPIGLPTYTRVTRFHLTRRLRMRALTISAAVSLILASSSSASSSRQSPVDGAAAPEAIPYFVAEAPAGRVTAPAIGSLRRGHSPPGSGVSAPHCDSSRPPRTRHCCGWTGPIRPTASMVKWCPSRSENGGARRSTSGPTPRRSVLISLVTPASIPCCVTASST